MMNSTKKFLSENLVNESHPFWWSLYCKMKLAQFKRHSRMSYAEIEAEIGACYERVFGRKLNWDNPQTYNEKINVSKVYMATPEKTRLADKYLVREWIREKIGEEYLIPLLGVYDSFDEIDFDALPDKFVIKCNHDSGSVTLVKDKSKIDRKILKRRYDFQMKKNFAWMGFEMHYRDIKPRIIIEQYMGEAIDDYKIMCFGEKSFYGQVHFDRFTNHTRNYYDRNWNAQPFYNPPTLTSNIAHPCPKEYSVMMDIAEILCKGFAQVRVDLYLVDSHIYFGEMTFTDGNGFAPFIPVEWDLKIGELWPFDNTIRRKILAQSSHP